jgi:uncharacterized membrane protein
LLVLAAVVAVLGPALTLVPLNGLRLLVGGLLLIFGLGWLRKAILRASGFKALHDEDAIYNRQLAAANAAASTSRLLVSDWYAFTLSFKGVLLEGLEVAFIVITFGSNEGHLGLAILGAAIAVVLVAVAGVAVHGPLARIPENTLKYVVGTLLTSFGIFWGAEGAGATWPGGDAALIGVIATVTVTSVAFTMAMRRVRARQIPRPPNSAVTTPLPR